MLFEDPGQYPRTGKYINEELPQVTGVHRITQNMRSYGKLSSGELKAALDPYGLPILMIGDGITIDASNRDDVVQPRGTYCWFKRSDPQFIYMNSSTIADYEYQRTGASTPIYLKWVPEKSRKTKMLNYVGAEILSTLVVWGLWTKTGKVDEEASENFQRAVYGCTIQVRISKQMAQFKG